MNHYPPQLLTRPANGPRCSSPHTLITDPLCPIIHPRLYDTCIQHTFTPPPLLLLVSKYTTGRGIMTSFSQTDERWTIKIFIPGYRKKKKEKENFPNNTKLIQLAAEPFVGIFFFFTNFCTFFPQGTYRFLTTMNNGIGSFTSECRFFFYEKERKNRIYSNFLSYYSRRNLMFVFTYHLSCSESNEFKSAT